MPVRLQRRACQAIFRALCSNLVDFVLKNTRQAISVSNESPYPVLLPKTSFPLRAAMAERSGGFLRAWQSMNLWQLLREQATQKKRELFVLHDGPPYANGHLHMGHALNKILKDIVNRSRQMDGWDAHYIPGWDCHGLPIEWKVEEEIRAQGKRKEQSSVADFRKSCRVFAEEWIGKQKKEFQELGVLGDWQNPYLTMDYASEARIAQEIGKFLTSGNLHQSARPVLWSVAEKTALADAEVEYHEHTSQAIHVAFPLTDESCQRLGLPHDTAILIWTTTPWTIPANRAIAYNERFSYRLAEDEKTQQLFLIEEACFDNNNREAWIEQNKMIAGKALAGCVARHPFASHKDKELTEGYGFGVPLLPAEYVTSEQGTGFVHTAPSHGEEDFKLGQKHGLPCDDTVDEQGFYTDKVAGFQTIFQGARVIDEQGKEGDANRRVIEALETTGLLLRKERVKHDYPHSWRSKTPLIFRTTSQWFIRMDWKKNKTDKTLREIALAEIEGVRFYPEQGKARLRDMIESRPDWCVSRQRWWGVPLPIFTDKKTGEPLREQKVIDRVSEIFAKEGADSWYVRDAQDFLPAPYKAEDYEQCQDIVEVWFDSGSTHAFVLEPRLAVEQADLYLEGSDQHRGWFHSSLLQACGTKGKAPYKEVLTHGFVLDEHGRKMSKSLGNITAPQEVVEKHGPDILRLWVASSNTSNDLRIGDDILKSCVDSYRRFRNTLRFLLGNLEENPAPPIDDKNFSNLPYLERGVLAILAHFDYSLKYYTNNYNFTRYINELHYFCSISLSSWFLNIRKDRLYCDAKDDPQRIACLSVMELLFEFLTTRLAPILCFTAEEAFQSLRKKRDEKEWSDSVHLQSFVDIPIHWGNDDLLKTWNQMMSPHGWHGALQKDIDDKRKVKEIGSSLELRICFPAQGAWRDQLDAIGVPDKEHAALLSELLIVSEVRFDDTLTGEPKIERITDWQKCARCWKYTPEVSTHKNHPALCTRCYNVVVSNAS